VKNLSFTFIIPCYATELASKPGITKKEGDFSMAGDAQDEQMQAYSEAVQSGLYAKKSGLTGKYDNVRRYWEDEITRRHFRPCLRELINFAHDKMRRVRILDLGCGSADGYELLSGIRQSDASLQEVGVTLLTGKTLGLYKGVDLNEDLLDQARAIYGNNPKMIFEKGDFTQGLPMQKDEKPYDLYFTSYGTCSHHNDDETFVQMMAEIAGRCEDYCLILCDWLGRWSYEWQDLWTHNIEEFKNMDYVVSYIYEKEERERRRDELQHLTLRLMSRQEAEGLIRKSSEKAGVAIKPLDWFDRSLFTGRHMDTGDYNQHAQPLRRAVNSLHEANQRTRWDTLFVNYVPKEGFPFLNDDFERIQTCWNTLVEYTGTLMEMYDQRAADYATEPPAIPGHYPAPLRDMMTRMNIVVRDVGWMDTGLPRENIIEPHLGYALRYLVGHLQKGQGCGHGLVGIFEIDKRS
jgi:SAM-dependent methyltransferase